MPFDWLTDIVHRLPRLHRIEGEYEMLKEEASKMRHEINKLRTVSLGVMGSEPLLNASSFLT